jgi:hypothetical protein
LWNAEHTLDAVGVPDRNLDVSSFVETRALVNWATLGEHALHCVDWLIASVSADLVNHLDNRAIQSSEQAVSRILGQFDTGLGSELHKVAMSGPNLFDASGRRQVKAQA